MSMDPIWVERASRPASRYPLTVFLWPLLAVLAIATVLVWMYRPGSWTAYDPNAKPRPVADRGPLDEDEQKTIELYKNARPSVVHVTRLSVQRDFSTMNLEQIPEGTGSGFIWDDAGHVVTNYHVVRGADACQVALPDDQTPYSASVVGAFPDKDMAVLWIQAPKSKLQPIQIGRSSNLQVGQKAFAIGNPFGLDQSLTTGIVSALDREINAVTGRPIKGVIQTNAAINPGNSGGPLLDSGGLLIGMTTAIVSPSGASAGIGFAIPVDEINRYVPEIIKHGKVTRPGLGVQLATDPKAARQLGAESGVVVRSVVKDGPAAKAGIRTAWRDVDGIHADVIVSLNDEPIQKANDLYSLLEKYHVGDMVKLTVERDGERRQVEVILGAI
ncbi:MAG TPA: trypsin-like peptidase domain-containing protein [Gemmataceae bacterium]|nr:trypsin-like peptidase domain-containing protein [Gemmataceae bacterium]